MYQNYKNSFDILDNNFYSLDECNTIKNIILSNKQLWQQSFVPYFSYFPLGLYLCSIDSYRQTVEKYKDVCFDLFGTYYLKLQYFLQDQLKVSLRFHNCLNYPGFHISNGNQMKTPNFHIDGFTLQPFLERKEKIYSLNKNLFSVVAVIDTLHENTGLLIRENTVAPINKLKYDRRIDYKKGMLGIWDAKLVHSIMPFNPQNVNDMRITMQCHIIISRNEGIIFW